MTERKIDVYDLCGLEADHVFSYCQKRPKITQDEFEELYTKCATSPYYDHQEKSKHFYEEFAHKCPEKAKYKLIKLKLFSYFLRSLLASDFSANHPSFGGYSAVLIDCWQTNNRYSEVIDKLIKEFKPHKDSHMPSGKSYWSCE
jgi:hypothetical protein